MSSLPSHHHIPWRSDSLRRIYSSKLLHAISRASTDDASSGASSVSAGNVRGIADRVLAAAAKGRTRWSRAMLANRVRATALGKRRRRKARPAAVGGRRWTKGRRSAVERRAKVLGRLVPGCQGISVTSILEEATDYIAALEMQVKAMTALSQQLLGSPAVRTSSDVAAPSARC